MARKLSGALAVLRGCTQASDWPPLEEVAVAAATAGTAMAAALAGLALAVATGVALAAAAPAGEPLNVALR